MVYKYIIIKNELRDNEGLIRVNCSKVRMQNPYH